MFHVKHPIKKDDIALYVVFFISFHRPLHDEWN